MVATVTSKRVVLTIIKRASTKNQQPRAISSINQLQFLTLSCLVFLLILIFSPLPCNAGMKTLLVDPDGHKFKLGSYVQILEDRSGKLEITDVSSPGFSDKFLANHSSSINQGITDSPYWFRFSLTATEKTHTTGQVEHKSDSTEWLLYLGKQLDFYDEIKVFWKGGNGQTGSSLAKWHTQTFGIGQAVASGKRNPLCISITLPHDSEQALIVYMRIKMVGGFFLEPILYSPEAYNYFSKKLCVFYGVYYGLVLSLVLYNLFHFFFLRDRVRLIFILYASTLCVYFLIANELSFTILPTSYLIGSRKIAQLLGLITVALAIYFTTAFLEAKRTVPSIYRLLQLVALVIGAVILALPFFSYYSMGTIIYDVCLVGVLLVILAGLVAWFRGYRPARFFLLAWMFYLGGGLVYIFNFKGVFPYAFIGNNAYQAGSGIEMLLLSLAIADRMKYLFEQLNLAQLRRQKQLNALTHQLVQTEERERRRIAGILHDSIGQTLCATKWEVQRLQNTSNPSEGLNSVVLPYLDSCIHETRSLTADLYPQVLYGGGLGAALQLLAEEFHNRFALQIKVSFGTELKVTSEDLRLILYRSVSELLNNVVKHANAHHVEILLLVEDGNITVSVQDDGEGFDYPTEKNAEITGFGLFSIQERLHRMGGSFNVEIPAAGGSRVTILVPEAGDK